MRPQSRRLLAGTLVAGIFIAAVLGFAPGLVPSLLGDDVESNGYDTATVTILDDGTEAKLGSVDAAVADTWGKRYVGLSETEKLAENRGMLFVHDDVDERTYVMRNMSFGIDIVFVDADGTITEIHNAPAPEPDEDGNDQQYTGRAKYVLEVNYGWTDEREIEPGDRLEFDL